MKTVLSLIIPLVLLSSCTTVKFAHPQPGVSPALHEFPAELTGIYVNEESDTLRISSDSITWDDTLFSFSGSLAAGDMVLKQWEELYVLNLRDSQKWEVFLLQSKHSRLQIGYLDLEEREQQIVSEIEEITPVKRIRNEEGKMDHYLLDPSIEEFRMLSERKLFSEIAIFRKIQG